MVSYFKHCLEHKRVWFLSGIVFVVLMTTALLSTSFWFSDRGTLPPLTTKDIVVLSLTPSVLWGVSMFENTMRFKGCSFHRANGIGVVFVLVFALVAYHF